MATRKALVLVSGLFQELNSSSDKLDFAGNSTTDLSEGSNQYFTNARARGAVSVTDSGGDGSLAYNSSTGVITYTGPSASEARAHFSVASGSGLTYNSGTGEFSTNAIPNSQLANSSVTVGSTAIALGNSSTTLAGLSSVTSTAVVTNDSGFRIRDNSDNTKQLAFECSGISGSTTRTLTVPDASDTLVVLAAAQTLTIKPLL